MLGQKYLQAAAANGWRISPLATAVTLSALDDRPYQPYRHLRLLSDEVRRCVATAGRLIVSMPPQHGKSWMISKWTPFWYLLNWPHKHIILAGYGQNFAQEWGRSVRNLVDRHKSMLSFQLAADSQRADFWHTDKDGSMLCAGIGGGISGKPGNLIIIDDPVKGHADASSFTYRERVWNWYTSEALMRIHRDTAIIIVMTRWNEDDLAGRLIKNAPDRWRVVNLPAIYDEQAAQRGPDPLGRNIGEPLCPELHDLDDLYEKMRSSREDWESLNQGRPGTTAGLGNVYHDFDQKQNVRSCDRDPMARLVWSMDFNVDPMCSIIAQYKEWSGRSFSGPTYKIVEVLDEIALENSNTKEAVDEFVVRAKRLCGNYDVTLEIYGDPAGGARHTSQVAGSDYDIIRERLNKERQFDVRYCVASSAPAIKDRVNAVNGLFVNALGERSLFIDPRCKMLIRDLLNVRWKRDLSGNTTGQLDKSQKDLTHISDALGYFGHGKFGRGVTVGAGAGIAQ